MYFSYHDLIQVKINSLTLIILKKLSKATVRVVMIPEIV